MRVQIIKHDPDLIQMYGLRLWSIHEAEFEKGYHHIWAIQNYGNYKGQRTRIRLKDSECRVLETNVKATEVNTEIQCVDVLQYYIGCHFHYTFNNGEVVIGIVNGVHKYGFMSGDGYYVNTGEYDWYEIDDVRKDGKLKLFLTDQIDMTEEQKRKYKDLCYKVFDSSGELVRIVDTPASLHYAFQNHIDGFDLIDRDLAMDLKNTPYKNILEKIIIP